MTGGRIGLAQGTVAVHIVTMPSEAPSQLLCAYEPPLAL